MERRKFATILLQISVLAFNPTVSIWGQQALPAPFPGWGPWQFAGECGGVQISVALSNDDGRNDFQVKLRMENRDGQRVATRLDASLTSDVGETKQYYPSATMNPGKSAEGGALAPSLSFGTAFQSAVFAKAPPRITKIVFRNVEVAQIDVFPANADPSTYFRNFGDHPTARCGPWTITPLPRYVALTEQCHSHLPTWTSACDAAVQEIVHAYENAPGPAKACILQWRNYQKCYEVYAFNSNPTPQPQCVPPPCSKL